MEFDVHLEAVCRKFTIQLWEIRMGCAYRRLWVERACGWQVPKRMSFQRILPKRAFKYSFSSGMAAAALALSGHLNIAPTVGGRLAAARDRVFARHYFPLKLYM
ncbi:hypothetical protein ASH09_10255 [Agrobacterium radiobacter]|nr:hypothetical protein L902_20545 [Agrobacterium radiobacter DSM 30147]KWT77940.1 hypothetical protein ASH09_10255 [Agrobacterium radiobacter]